MPQWAVNFGSAFIFLLFVFEVNTVFPGAQEKFLRIFINIPSDVAMVTENRPFGIDFGCKIAHHPSL
jgi:hypothetical protein